MKSPLTIIGLGESLFDVFPHQSLLGGAPLNVAVMSSQLLSSEGGRGIPVSRVGKDELGRRMSRELSERNIVVDYLQKDSNHPTGQVVVDVVRGEPDYRILEDAAWDCLEWSESWKELAAECDAVCFGTLAQRSKVSRESIQNFLSASCNAIILFDVNLRQDFYSKNVVVESLEKATIVKMNEHEFPIVQQLVDLDSDSFDEAAQRLRRRFALDAVVLTQGRKGTTLYTASGRASGEAISYKPHSQADSVGAGDACSAAILTGMLLEWSPLQTISLANHLGAFVASQPGATPELPASILEPYDWPSRQ